MYERLAEGEKGNNIPTSHKKVSTGEIRNMTGISAPYEEPEHSDLIIETDKLDLQQCVNEVISFFAKTGFDYEGRVIGLKTK